MLEDAPAEARRYFALAYRAQMERRLDAAIELYGQSIAAHPTAEAHTFRGWAYAWQRRFEDAIAECETAIRIDPDFGNPYNDIGSYLIELGRAAEAVPWLERAVRARRYEPRHYPHTNLARVYTMQDRLLAALDELRAALVVAPDYEPAREHARRIHRRLAQLN